MPIVMTVITGTTFFSKKYTKLLFVKKGKKTKKGKKPITGHDGDDG